jgi:hypothetical protein
VTHTRSRPGLCRLQLSTRAWLTIAALLTVGFNPHQAAAQSPLTIGPNVNIGGGPATFNPATNEIVGDPFLQRQNEPSIAVSSRNPCHLLAGANDYRAVDVEEAVGEVGDAWLGVFKSFDCGATWTSRLLPGHKLDTSAAGLASPIKGLAAGADPTVRAGTSGLFYYSGIAFDRGDREVGKVFVSRFIDNNNNDGGDPIQYLGTLEIDRGTSGQFLDKPWVVADIPRGQTTCTVNGQRVPAGMVYVVYTSFVGGDNNIRSKIMFSRSTNCGATWSNPAKLSERIARNQGTTIAIDPGTGDVHIAWREFAVAGDASTRDAILVSRSTDEGRTFTAAAAISTNNYQFLPFDQASSPLTFRTNAYPTIAVVPAAQAGQRGKVYVAWAARGFVPLRSNQAQGDARIVMSSAIGGVTWSAPAPTDTYTGAGHQIMPSLAFAGGKLALAYYDLRNDASGGFDDLVFEYGQAAFDACMLSPGTGTPTGFAAVLQCIVNSSLRLSRRHTLDMRVAVVDAQCLAAGICGMGSSSVLTSRKVSRYVEGLGARSGADLGPRYQLQYNRPNLPIFSRGRFPFIGDYIDIAGQSFVATGDGGWSWNTGQTGNRPAPVFHVTWADNRNVGSPVATAGWEPYTPPVLGPNSVACVPGQVGVRNQDVYTAQIRPGLVVSVPQNAKRIVGLQRSFVVVANNTTDFEHRYVLRANPPDGVVASFDQFLGFGALDTDGDPTLPTTEIVVSIPRKSSAARTVFVGFETSPPPGGDAPDVLVPITVEQLPDPASTSDFDVVFLNPDFENPDFENPDFENAELHNPDFENPDFENPDFENPDFENFTLSAASAIRNPDFENPDFENPDFENPDFENPDFENPDFENPDFENPDFENPDFENPDFENPDFENPDFENGSFEVADTTWPVRNNGNTTSAYKANVSVGDPPDGVSYQLIVRKLFTNPAAMCTVDGKTSAPLSATSAPLVNIVDPNVVTNPFDRSFNDASRENASFSLAPGERGLITLRAYCSASNPNCTRNLMASFEGNVALGVVAHGANCVTGDDGIGDGVGGASTCAIVDGPPRDIYDPVPPMISVVNPTVIDPEVKIVRDDANNDGVELVSFAVAASDNVGVSSVACVADGITITPTSANGTYGFSGVFPVGTTGVICTASDVRTPAPNMASVNFLIEVRSIVPPTFNLDPNIPAGSPFGPGNPAEATGPTGAVVTYTTPTATDNAGAPAAVTCASPTGLVSGSFFPIGVTDINCVATDTSGNSTPPTNLFDITVADTTAPVLAGLVNRTAEATSAGGAVVTYALPDDAGNIGRGSFTVTVRDSTAPVLGPIANVIAEATATSGAVVTYATPSASDAVGATVACLPASGSTFALGISTVTCTARDAANNISMSAFTVTVRDTTPPVIGAASNVTAEATSAAGAVVTYATPTATDIFGATISCAPTSGSVFPLGATAVLCTAQDPSANRATRSFTVTVSDTIAPVVTEAASTTVLLWSPNRTMTPVTISGRITDATLASASYRVVDEYRRIQPRGTITVAPDGSYSFVVSLEAYRNGNDYDGRTYTVIVTATDAAGRTGTAQVIIRVPHSQ